jgi:hypothetical protein
MTPEDLAEGYRYVRNSFFSISSIVRRLPYLLRVSPGDYRRAAVSDLLNLAARAERAAHP